MALSTSYPNIGAQAEFLTYLVMSQLVKHHLTGRWLTVEHLVESTHLWMQVNDHVIDVLERVSLASLAREMATHVLSVSEDMFDAKTLGGAFLDHLNLNYECQAVAKIYSSCVAFLVHERFSIEQRSQPDGQ